MARLLGFLFTFLLFVSSLQAQTDTGSITGTVKDEEGKPLPGVTITAKDQQTDTLKTTESSSDGTYYMPSLRPSIYDLTANLSNFGTLLQKGVVVAVGTRVTVNLVLKPHLEEQVEVTAVRSIETTQSHVSEVVSQKQIESLPLNGRNFMELAFLTPGTFPAPNFDPTKTRVVEISSPGNLGRGGNVMVDGTDDNDDVVGGVLQNFSQDAIGQFQVLTHRFSAENGRSASSVVNVITKSGTNDLHGGAFLFYRDAALQSKNPLLAENTKEPPFDREQFGFTAGGPIKKDKAFWFASFEDTNEDGATSAAFRDIEHKQIVNILAPTPLDERLLTLRIDVPSGTNIFFGRYSFQGNTIVSKGLNAFGAPTSDPSNFQDATNHFHSGVFGWTRLLSNTKVNEFRLGEINFVNELNAPENSQSPELIFPSIIEGSNELLPQRTPLNRFEMKDDFTWNAGKHLFKFGGEIQRLDSGALFDLFGSGSVILTEDFATEDRNGDGIIDDNDIPVAFSLRSDAVGVPTVKNLDNTFWAGYIQDDFRLRENVTFNIGLRYELDTQANGANKYNEAERIHFAPNENTPRTRDKNNFGPRLGFVWDISGDARTVVRGGYGIYYDRIVFNVPVLERLLNGSAIPVLAFGESLLDDPFGGESASTSLGINILENGLQNPRIQQFNAGLDKRITNDFVVSADYVGSRGDNFLIVREVNHPRLGVTVDPTIPDNVGEIGSIATVSYDGMLLSARKRFANNLNFQASYTLARMTNWGNDDQGLGVLPSLDNADPSKDESQAEHQPKHRLVINGIYEAPHGFQISGIFTYSSNLPFDIRTNHDFLGDGTLDRFPLLPRNAGGREVHTGAELNQWILMFNTSSDPTIVAMRTQCGCTLPLVDPNLKFTDNFINLDLRFSKSFTVGRYRVEPIVELFNVFNVTNIRGSQANELAGYVRNMESPDFGKPVSTAGGVFGQGGPFAMQLAVKFSF